jgi:hypothetical protein
MSVHMLEKLLWEVTQQPSRAAEFKADPDRFLLAYALEADEVALIKNLDVRGMMACAVNPMLIMRIWSLIKGRDQTAEYLRRLGADK